MAWHALLPPPQAAAAAHALAQQQELHQCQQWVASPAASKVQRLYAAAMLHGGDMGEAAAGLAASEQAQLAAFAAERRGALEEQQRAARASASDHGPGGGDGESASPVLRLLVRGVTPHALGSGCSSGGEAVVRVWRPTEDASGLAEGEVYLVCALEAHGMEDIGAGRRVLRLHATR